LGQAHFELIADRTLGLSLGQRLALGKDTYTVVGLTANTVAFSGDAMVFVTLLDAQAIQFDGPGEAVRLERQARRARLASVEPGITEPALLERAAGPSSGVPVLAPAPVSAVLVRVAPGFDPGLVAATIGAWPDVSVHSDQQQREFLLNGAVDRSRRQLGLFRGLLVAVSAIVMALILYTLTLDKVHDIAVLKLVGARTSTIVGLILQQALLLGGLGYCVACLVGAELFPRFPRRVVLVGEDLWTLAGVVLVISTLASLLGIWRALRVEPNEVLS
jgi:putative ABC transport system permease protein